ncbi:hypothetical protein A3C96_01045 [Candidatus Uhrbacteria bacterium RIFCSPHIGHO2_02_FULL_60_10]|uniref:Membrane insertase YidC/Oxa/ALB C-terminal domain-containing protein n=1 Tax=Candidatus Uhrbacteria bacterium RIFCSPHIGHO2_02_FULL_60_10 TaxID=1802392 RepID=A0A1F7U2H9_9BACT|nr:MAG: hypothetical protein A3C96_01045 [Candidatus Uhrbacteria bacterium RIFCSPHIGHO2_02_FULL_60_10]
MAAIFQAIFYRPIFNLLIGLVNVIPGHDIGLAIIVLTILIKAVLWPLSARALKQQRELQSLQPKVDEIKKQYAGNKDEMGKRLMELYSKEKVNPLSSCLPLLIQLPVFIALYSALSHGLKSSGFDLLYPFVSDPGTLDPKLFGLVPLADPNYVLAILSGITQFFQARMMVTKQQPKKVPGAQDEQMMVAMNKQMMYTMPVLTTFIAWKLPGGLTLYWFVMNLLTIAQQYLTMRPVKVVASDAVAVAAPKQ